MYQKQTFNSTENPLFPEPSLYPNINSGLSSSILLKETAYSLLVLKVATNATTDKFIVPTVIREIQCTNKHQVIFILRSENLSLF